MELVPNGPQTLDAVTKDAVWALVIVPDTLKAYDAVVAYDDDIACDALTAQLAVAFNEPDILTDPVIVMLLPDIPNEPVIL
jgi:hypothetical protein